MVAITNHVLLGNREAAANLPYLRSIGVSHVLNCARQCPPPDPAVFIAYHLRIVDAPDYDISRHFAAGSQFIQDAVDCRTRVLVHCVAGVSRSVTMVVAWLIAHRRTSLLQAIRHCQSAGAAVHPNEGFRLHLAKFEVATLGVSSVRDSRDPMWNFYAWNKLRTSMPKPQQAHAARRVLPWFQKRARQAPPGSVGGGASSAGCCCCAVQ